MNNQQPPYTIYGSPRDPSEKEINLYELCRIVWQGKWIVGLATITFAVISIVTALMLPNVYKSNALLVSSEKNSGAGLAALAGNFGGLASLAGIDLSGGGDNKVTTAIEVMRSRKFVTDIIGEYEMLVPLMAAKGWDRKSNKLLIDEDIYDKELDKWVRNVSPPKMPKPSMWEAYEEFSKIFKVSQDKTTGLISVSVQHYSPHVASLWTEIFVKEINRFMREKDVFEAQRSIAYLNQQLEKTSVADMRSVFFQLIEEQTKTMMLAEVREEYIFSVIDPPVIPEEKFKPKRSVICILGTLLGVIFGTLLVFVMHFYREAKLEKQS